MGSTGLAGLEILEEKILKAAELIENLSKEKKKLEENNKELKDKVDSLYIRSEGLMKEIEIFNNDKGKRKDFDKTREEIGNKIEEMLLKLDGLEL